MLRAGGMLSADRLPSMWETLGLTIRNSRHSSPTPASRNSKKQYLRFELDAVAYADSPSNSGSGEERII